MYIKFKNSIAIKHEIEVKPLKHKLNLIKIRLFKIRILTKNKEV